MNGSAIVLGGTGLVGRSLSESFARDNLKAIQFAVHRSRPDWLNHAEIVGLDIVSEKDLQRVLTGHRVVVNMLRPDGDGRLKDLASRLVKILPKTNVTRVIHLSSIDVYGPVAALEVTEDTAPSPQSSYAREHLAAEKIISSAPVETVILRIGAVFGPGSKNLANFVEEARTGPTVKLALRRALYGDRRMHLVSVENVAEAIKHFSQAEPTAGAKLIHVTDDEELDNNFAFVQDKILSAFGRPSLKFIPKLPIQFLRAAQMAARSEERADPRRRFSSGRLHSYGFYPSKSFENRFSDYVNFLKS